MSAVSVIPLSALAQGVRWPPLLTWKGELPLRGTLFQGSHFAVLRNKLVDIIGESRGSKLESLDGDQPLGMPPGKRKREASAKLVEHLEFYLGRRQVISRELFEQCRGQRFRLG